MKRILITGANSYIGQKFESYIQSKFAGDYEVDTVDMIDGSWRQKSFSGYDAVFHVAGIAHSDDGKISEEKAKLYYSVNTDLTIETAKKAKLDGVKQFIFMSSAIVYGASSKIGKSKVITRDTEPTPANCYGDSKLQAEKGILALDCEEFKVVVLRPPMIYGEDCKGNYPTLSKLSRKLPIFPRVKNQRSMLYVGNLVEFVRLMIANGERGIFWPQNAKHVSTVDIYREVRRVHGKKARTIPGFGWALRILGLFTQLVNKAFGSLSYELSMSEYKEDYRIVDFEASIENTEKNNG